MANLNLFQVLSGSNVIVCSKEDEFEKGLGYVVTWNDGVALSLWTVREGKFVKEGERMLSSMPMSFRVANVMGITWLKEMQDELEAEGPI